jgi:hypothetical protein
MYQHEYQNNNAKKMKPGLRHCLSFHLFELWEIVNSKAKIQLLVVVHWMVGRNMSRMVAKILSGYNGNILYLIVVAIVQFFK